MLKLAREGELTEFIEKLKEKKAKNTSTELNELEKVLKTNRELRELLDQTVSGERDQFLMIQQQNRMLREQLELQERIARERQIREGINVVGGTVATFSQTNEFAGVGDLEKTVSRMQSLRVQAFEVANITKEMAESIGFNLQELSDRQISTLDSIISGANVSQSALLDIALTASESAEFMSDEWVKSVQRMIAETEQLNSVVRNGLGNIIADFAAGIGEGDPFSALRQSVGSFAQDLGRTFIGFGVAGESLKAFLNKNPGAAIVAGASLVGLGAALKKTAQNKM